MSLTTTDLDNAALDCEFISKVANVNYTSATATNRDGDVIDTVIGRLAKLGYLPAVTYAGGIAFTVNDNTKTIVRSGIIYAPLYDELPFTTSGTWAADDELKFFIVQDSAVTDALVADVADLVTLTGRPANSTNMGTFTGNVITDNQDLKDTIQEVADYAETVRDENWELISTQTPTAIASIDLTLVPGTYKRYRIEFDRIRPAAGSTYLKATLNGSVGPYYGQSARSQALPFLISDAYHPIAPNTATIQNGDRLSGFLIIENARSLVPTLMTSLVSYSQAGATAHRFSRTETIIDNTTQHTQVELAWNGQNFNASGTITVYAQKI